MGIVRVVGSLFLSCRPRPTLAVGFAAGAWGPYAWRGRAVGALAGAISLAGCGGSPGGSVFIPSPPDAATPAPYGGGLLGPDAGSAADANVVCVPASTAGFTPTWKGPTAVHSGACTSAQISSFYDDCLSFTSDSATCDGFVKANTACTACLQSNDTDATYGAIIWHSSHAYFTTNIAGCIAAETGDTSPTGCAATYQGIVECKEAACSACLAAKDPAGFSTCESKATGCGGLPQTCIAEIRDASDPASTCIPPAGTTTQDAYLRIAPIFCGN
jgi:hypothetical protein